jgi:hypothetical protein
LKNKLFISLAGVVQIYLDRKLNFLFHSSKLAREFNSYAERFIWKALYENKLISCPGENEREMM